MKAMFRLDGRKALDKAATVNCATLTVDGGWTAW